MYMRVYVYVCLCVCMCVCMNICIQVCVSLFIILCSSSFTYAHIYVCLYIQPSHFSHPIIPHPSLRQEGQRIPFPNWYIKYTWVFSPVCRFSLPFVSFFLVLSIVFGHLCFMSLIICLLLPHKILCWLLLLHTLLRTVRRCLHKSCRIS